MKFLLYIFSRVMRNAIMLTFSFCIIIIAIDFSERIGGFIENELDTLAFILPYYGNFSLILLRYVFPEAIFLATFLAVVQTRRSKEMVPVVASGIGTGAALWPLYLAVIAIALPIQVKLMEVFPEAFTRQQIVEAVQFGQKMNHESINYRHNSNSKKWIKVDKKNKQAELAFFLKKPDTLTKGVTVQNIQDPSTLVQSLEEFNESNLDQSITQKVFNWLTDHFQVSYWMVATGFCFYAFNPLQRKGLLASTFIAAQILVALSIT